MPSLRRPWEAGGDETEGAGLGAGQGCEGRAQASGVWAEGKRPASVLSGLWGDGASAVSSQGLLTTQSRVAPRG